MARRKSSAITRDPSGGATPPRVRMRMESAAGTTSGPGSHVMKFGSVILEHGTVGEGELKQNVASGRSALNGMKVALSAPGVKLKAAKGVPLYQADPQHPDRLVQVLDGKRQSGRFVDGRFQAV